MKLVLANGQKPKFRQFFADIQKEHPFFDYAGYLDLLFVFDGMAQHPAEFINLRTGRKSYEYTGAYLKGYDKSRAEFAFAVATVLDNNGVAYIDTELHNAPCLTKLHAHAKLAAAGVRTPRTYAGSRKAVIKALGLGLIKLKFPLILKRADIDRGIDNFTVNSETQLRRLLRGREQDSIWIVQEFIPNDGFYRVNLSFGEVQFVIFRKLEERPDHNKLLAHMFKPKGGANASLVNLEDLSPVVTEVAVKAAICMNRQCAGVDVICDAAGQAYILEVNDDPQLVTTQTFAKVRRKAFIDLMKRVGQLG